MTEVLRRMVLARLGADEGAWFQRALGERHAAALAASFAVTRRKLGSREVTPNSDERAALGASGHAWVMASASLDELARIVLVVQAAEAAEASSIAAEWFRQGDNGEKRAVLRALALLPKAETCVEVGATACRSSVQSVFEAICCENPYPAAHFPDLAFNQMVLKALFTGVALERIERLSDRKNAELARMAAGYASERSAAGRSVPMDIDRVLQSSPKTA
jgi:hypothetical protein